MTDQELNEQPNSQEIQAVTPEPPSAAGPNILMLLTAGLLLIFLIIGGFYMYQQTQLKRPASITSTPAQRVPTIQELAATPTPDELAIPTVSDATDLQTIEGELDRLNVASPESDLKELDSDASQL